MNTKQYYLLAIISLSLLISCAGSKHSVSYKKTALTISRDSITVARKKINDIALDKFDNRKFTSSQGTAINYRLLKPISGSSQKRYPLVVVLHGSHAVGTDNNTQMGILAKLWASQNIYSEYPAYVIAPQFPSRSSNYSTDPKTNVLVSEPQACLNDALMLIDSLCKEFPIDQKRIYIIGHSMGASGAINALSLRPNMFAAAVSASGIPNFTNMDVLTHTPIWLIHGNKDTENPMDSDVLLYQSIQKRNGKQLKFDEIDGMEHELWPGLFLTDALPKWLFNQKRK